MIKFSMLKNYILVERYFMKLILDTENNLEYLFIQNLDSLNSMDPFKRATLIEHLISTDFIKQIRWKYKSTELRFDRAIPIGTTFTTLYNLSIMPSNDLEIFFTNLEKKAKKNEELNDAEFLSWYLLGVLGKTEIENLIYANLQNDVFGYSMEKLRAGKDRERMISEHFLSLKKEDRLLMCKLVHPRFSIKENIQIGGNNPISNFFCIFSYFLLSFCISFLHHLIQQALNLIGKKSDIENTYLIFFKIIKNRNKEYQGADFGYILDSELSLSIEEKNILYSLNDSKHLYFEVNVFNWFIDIYNSLLDNLEFHYLFNPREETGSETDNIATFLYDSANSINEILKVYNAYTVKIIEGNKRLPLLFSFSLRSDSLNSPKFHNSYVTTQRQDINEYLEETIDWDLVDDINFDYGNYTNYRNQLYYFGNSYNTSPFKSSIKDNENICDPYNYISSPYIDVLIMTLLWILNSDYYDSKLSYEISYLYNEYFYYFSFLRTYEPTANLFPNENLVSIQCDTPKDLLIASFYAVTYYGRSKINKCHDRNCKCIYLNDKKHDIYCDFIEYHSNISKQSEYSSLKQEYDNFVRNIDIVKKKNKIFNIYDKKLINIKHENLSDLISKEQKIINETLNLLFKISYTLITKIEYEQAIVNNMNSLVARELFKITYQKFKYLTKQKEGIYPLQILLNKNELKNIVSTRVENNEKTISDLYKFEADEKFLQGDFIKYDINDYIHLIDLTEKIFINLLIAYHKHILEHPNLTDSKLRDCFNVPMENKLLRDYNLADYYQCIEWCKEHQFYNGVKIIISEINKLRDDINKWDNETWENNDLFMTDIYL